MGKLNVNKTLVVDLYSGEYARKHIGHEDLNLIENPVDGNFYGYCPPWDGVAIGKLGAKKDAEYIDDITVVYVRKREGSNNRVIIAFCLNARVFRKAQSGDKLNRLIDEDGEIKTATFSIMSDNLYDLKTRLNKFEIKIQDYNNYMFRKQRFYSGTYPELDNKIISYLENYLETKSLLDNDDSEEQEEIQMAEPASLQEIQDSAKKPLCIANGNHGKVIAKDSRITKSVLLATKYTCAINPTHKTFITKNKVPYMEGHHLIPCTVTNSEYFWKKFNKNIDCFENIVCLCPNCHREVHYGEWDNKSEKIKAMFKKQEAMLKRIGVFISEEELLSLYKNKDS